MNSKSVKDGLAGALIALILVFLAHQVWYGLNHDYRNSFEPYTKNALKQISILVNMYHDDYDEFPANLETLYKGYKPNILKFKLPCGFNADWEFDWLYYPPRVFINKIDCNQIMLATPTHWDKDKKPGNAYYESFRIVAYYDGTVKKISEEEYQKKMKAMTNNKPKR